MKGIFIKEIVSLIKPVELCTKIVNFWHPKNPLVKAYVTLTVDFYDPDDR